MSITRKLLDSVSLATVSALIVTTAAGATVISASGSSPMASLWESGDDSGPDSGSRPGRIDGSGTTTSTSTSTTMASSGSSVTSGDPATPATGTRTVPVLDAGTVSYRVTASQVSIVEAVPQPGWRAIVEVATGREAEVSFINGGARVDLNLELEDGEVRLRIRDRRTEERTETRVAADGSTSTTSPTTSIPSTMQPPAAPESPDAGQHTLRSRGGSVVVVVSGNGLSLTGTAPNAGYTADVRDAGPDRVEVRFESENAESRIAIRLHDGRIRQEVEDR